MPVTAKLSRKFYEKFGDDVASELVNWFNDVDATYRTDLRELNELNFARFDAKLEQRVAQLEAKMDARFAEFRAEFHASLARLEGGLIARIALAESRQTRLLLATWIATLGAVVALIKL
jgi:hypothetical protein